MELKKGVVSSLETEQNQRGHHTKARVLLEHGSVSGALVISEAIQGHMQPEDEVLFLIYEDGGGLILSRADGRMSGGDGS